MQDTGGFQSGPGFVGLITNANVNVSKTAPPVDPNVIDESNAEPMIQSLRIFSMFDIDKNGKVDLNEIKVICKSLGLHPTVVN